MKFSIKVKILQDYIRKVYKDGGPQTEEEIKQTLQVLKKYQSTYNTWWEKFCHYFNTPPIIRHGVDDLIVVLTKKLAIKQIEEILE